MLVRTHVARATLLLVFLQPGSGVAPAQDEAEEIMRAVVHQGSAEDQVVKVTMRLVSRNGDERRRTAILYSKKRSAEDDMRMIRFESPPDLANSGILSIEHSDGDPDQWLYMPAYHTSRKVAAVNRSGTWMGTDFAYEDIVDPRLSQYRYRIVGQESLDGVSCAVVEAIPVDSRLASQSAYSKAIYWIDRGNALFVRVDFYDRGGELFKKLINSDLVRVGAYRRWGRTQMQHLKRQHSTILEFSDWKVDAGLSDRYFTVRYLERGM